MIKVKLDDSICDCCNLRYRDIFFEIKPYPFFKCAKTMFEVLMCTHIYSKNPRFCKYPKSIFKFFSLTNYFEFRIAFQYFQLTIEEKIKTNKNIDQKDFFSQELKKENYLNIIKADNKNLK